LKDNHIIILDNISFFLWGLIYSKGVLAESNAQLVERIVKVADIHGRAIAKPDETRVILGIV